MHITSIKIPDPFPDHYVWTYANNKIEKKHVHELISNKRVVLFSNPGVYFASYIGSQIVNYEFNYDKLMGAGVDEVYCLVNNDPYVVANYCNTYNIKNIKFICDVDNTLINKCGYLYDFTPQGLGHRPWPFACDIKNSIIYKIFYEDIAVMPIDCYSATSAVTMLTYLTSK